MWAVWVVMEQVAEAALDVKALDLAFTIVQEIRKKFPETQRAQRITVSSPFPVQIFSPLLLILGECVWANSIIGRVLVLRIDGVCSPLDIEAFPFFSTIL